MKIESTRATVPRRVALGLTLRLTGNAPNQWHGGPWFEGSPNHGRFAFDI